MSKELRNFGRFLIGLLLTVLLAAPVQAAVGRTEGVFAVSNSGTATYMISVFTPPGPRGIQPSIALVYSSNGPAGYVGKGWTLGGLSSIGKCNRTIAQDGVTGLSENTFCKDGNRLRLQSGSFGAVGEWATELADFSRIKSISRTTSPYVPYWTVETKDGLTYKYGYSPDSIHGDQWMVNEIMDRDGNVVHFTYAGCINNLVACPTKIEWARTSSSTSTEFIYSMEFGYTSFNQLDSISIKSSGALTRKYLLTYTSSPTTGAKRLDAITECAGSSGTDCLSSTEIDYQNGGLGVSSSGAYIFPAPNSISANFDYNGDGLSDLTYECGSNWCARLATGGGSFSGEYVTGKSGQLVGGDPLGNGRDVLFGTDGSNVRQAYAWTGNGFSKVSTGLAIPDYLAAISADVNGDGRDDLITHLSGFQMYLSQSSGSTLAFNSSAVSASLPGIQYMPAVDWYGSEKPGTAVYQWAGARPLNHPWTKRKLDANGDGKQDLILAATLYIDIPADNSSECELFWYGCFPGYQGYEPYSALILANDSGTEFSTAVWSLADDSHFAQLGIDHCTDLVFENNLVLSQDCLIGGSNVNIPYPVAGIIDWDADGRSDILVHIYPNSTLSVLRSLDGGLSAPEATDIPSSCQFFILDADGDGLDDAGCRLSGGVYVYLHNSPGITPDLAVSFVDGFGVSHGVEYKISTQEGYTAYSNATYPEQDVNRPRNLARTVTSSDGAGGTYATTYSYFGATRNLQGRGAAGFEKVESVDSRDSIKNVRKFERTFPFTGMLVEDSLYQPGGTLISTKILTPWSATLDATSYNQRHFAFVSALTEDVYEVGGASNGNWITRTSVSNTYDNFGNLTASTRTVTDKDGNSPLYGYDWVTSTSASYSPNTTYWCLGLPTATSVVQSTTTGEAGVTRSKSFTPDYVNCRIDAESVEPYSSALRVDTSYGYDSFGNVNSVSVTGRNPNGSYMTTRTTASSWGTTGQFPESVTNPLSQTTTRTFHPTFGSLVSETDPNGISVVSSNEYDTFGRLTRTIRADGTATRLSYHDCATYGCLNGDPGSGATGVNRMIVIASERSTSDAQIRDSWTYVDQFDRPIVKKEMTLGGGYSRSGVVYDASGRVLAQTAPCDAASCTAYWISNTYDLLGRVTQQSRPFSQGDSTPVISSFAYAGRTQSVTDANNKNSTKILDVNGWMRRSTDHNGYYQVFGYDAAGSLKQVTDSLSNTLFTASYSYGALPFQVATTDMDLGAWSYVRNSLGELVSWTDAKSQSFSQTYDALSRVTSRTEAEGTTTWTWGTSAGSKNIGRLAGVSMSGYSESFTYDGVGRPSTQTITTDQSYAIDYAYTSQGLLDTLTYPTSTSSARVKVKYGYANGILQSVTDWTSGSAGTVYWTANAHNVRGQTTQETLGNGVVTTRSFDAVTGWLSTIQSGPSGGTGLQNLGYAYDAVGNVTQRQENTLGLSESFYYNDNLHRLTSSQVNSNAPVTYTYDAMGNITNRSDVNGGATWTYHSTKKHAVATTGSGGSSYSYDANGNMTNRAGSTIHWSSFNYPTYLATATENTTFYYGPDRQYYRQDYNGPSSAETTYYIGGLLEKVCPSSSCASGTIDWRHYIKAEGQTVAIVSRKSSGTNVVDYLLEDNQLSTSVLTNSSGTNLARASYSAFGQQRDGNDWDGAVPSGDLTAIEGITRRGYTSHTMLARMGLIHMNGRVQDATLGRFLSADPYVMHPGLTQGYNRYAYVYNNPSTYIDPSGFATFENCTYVPTLVPFFDFWYRDTDNGRQYLGFTGTIRFGYGGGSTRVCFTVDIPDDRPVDSQVWTRVADSPPVKLIRPQSEADLERIERQERGIAAIENFLSYADGGVSRLAGAIVAVRAARGAARTSREARREAMRLEGIPTSRSAMTQSGSAMNRQLTVGGADGSPKVVTHHPSDAQHPNPHWHAGDPKTDPVTGEMRTNSRGQIKYRSDGSVVEYTD